MPRYNYLCYDCGNKLEEKLGREPTNQELLGSQESPGAVFETIHSMDASKKEIFEASECPMCGGHNTEKTCIEGKQHFYNKGYGWLDKSGIKRDMNLHRLTEHSDGDPYAEHRVPGEVDDLAHRLAKGPQKKPKVYDVAPRNDSD